MNNIKIIHKGKEYFPGQKITIEICPPFHDYGDPESYTDEFTVPEEIDLSAIVKKETGGGYLVKVIEN